MRRLHEAEQEGNKPVVQLSNVQVLLKVINFQTSEYETEMSANKTTIFPHQWTSYHEQPVFVSNKIILLLR